MDIQIIPSLILATFGIAFARKCSVEQRQPAQVNQDFQNLPSLVSKLAKTHIKDPKAAYTPAFAASIISATSASSVASSPVIEILIDTASTSIIFSLYTDVTVSTSTPSSLPSWNVSISFMQVASSVPSYTEEPSLIPGYTSGNIPPCLHQPSFYPTAGLIPPLPPTATTVIPNQPVQRGHATPPTIQKVRKTDLILMYHSDEPVPSTSPEVYRRMLSHPAQKDDIQLLGLNEVFLRSSFNQFMFGGINAPDADVFAWVQTLYPK
jgi:hypothetical protein